MPKPARIEPRGHQVHDPQRAPIEGWSGLPTADQQRALGYAIEDAQKAVAALNKLAAERKVKGVNVPRPSASTR